MPGNQEVMWPRLVANKILRKTLGSNNFVADFPIEEDSVLETPSSFDINNNNQECKSSAISPLVNHRKDTRKYKIFVSTWNVGGVAPPDDLDMQDLLDTYNTTCDVYVLGFQEVVPLRASNVLGSDRNKISMKWNALIRKALNKNHHRKVWDENGKQAKMTAGLKQDRSSMKKETVFSPPEFQCVMSKQMVGILISVWVRSDLRPFIRFPSVSCVGCGVMGCLGNKGSVSVRFRIHETSFCFVCSHLASGGREGAEKNRNSNVVEIFSRTCFPRGPLFDLPRKILDHDQVIFLGDLNYRINLPEETTRLLVNKKEWITLLENDQLKLELTEGQVFEGWYEGFINFSPTYKFYPNSDVYYGCGRGKKGEKRRAPAWCDRIIWKGKKGLKQDLYARGHSNISDHRPVKAIFTAEVEVLRAPKGLQSLLSDRFDGMKTTRFDVSVAERIFPQARSSFRI